MSDILLSTLNARYSHASLGLRCLRANLGALHARSAIKEFVIGQKTEEIAEAILAAAPKILGLGVYIWNCEESLKLVLMLKAIRPDLIIVLGGPEVSYESSEQQICQVADYTISGWGDISFGQLCAEIFAGNAPEAKIIPGIQAKLPDLAS
ncbi:MAG: cobalamin-dependent protein, partial [Arenimonas sp.]|nr:cobalamin-dependent protein [Arenimonas sp.]